MTSFLCRKEALEEVDGFDESIDYGEDADLPLKIREAGYQGGDTGAVIYYSFISSFGEVFRQGRWYGKSLIPFLKKHPENFPTLLMMLYFTTWPITTALGFVIRPLLVPAILQNLGVLFYIIIGLYRSRSIYFILAPIIKAVRGYGELLGLLESFRTSDIGRG